MSPSSETTATVKPATMLLLGVGGAGGRIVNDTVTRLDLGPTPVYAVDTDLNDLARLTNCRPRSLGESTFKGLGTSSQDVLARTVAKQESAALGKLFEGIRFAVIVTGLGGGAGSGITPELLGIAYSLNIPTLVFTVSPFSFESDARRQLARRTRPILEERGSVVIHFENDELLAGSPAGTLLEESRALASHTLVEGIALLLRLVLHPGYIGLDWPTLSELLRSCRGRAHFAYASAEGDDRVATASAQLTASPFARYLSKAPALAVGILGGRDLRLKEVGDTMAAIRAAVPAECLVQMGTVLEPTLDGRLSLALIAFEQRGENSMRADAGPASPVDTNSAAAPAALADPTAESKPRHRAAARPVARRRASSDSKDRFYKSTEELDEPTYVRRGLIIHAD